MEEAPMSGRSTRLSRRNFLLTLGAGGAATAAAVVTAKKSPPAISGKDKRATRGYHATEHVNNYYRTTKV
jgi:shikimate 5-dehydrogenase